MRYLARLCRALALAGGFALVSGFGSLPETSATPTSVVAAAPIDVGEEVAAFYRDRGFQPLWIAGDALRPEARRLLGVAGGSAAERAELEAAVAAAASGDDRALARADLLLSRTYVQTVADLHRPPTRSAMRYIDAGLAPTERPARALLEEAAAAPSLGAHLDTALRVNPAFDGLHRGLAAWRARWSRLPQLRVDGTPGQRAQKLRRRLGLAAAAPDAELAAALRQFQSAHGLSASGRADAATLSALNAGAGHYERLILANIERARAIPARAGRYILVDTASARLWMVENGRIAGSMRVIVGKPAMPTPVMAGLIRYAVFNPYWNLPPDLIRKRARNVLRRGTRAIAAEQLQILSDWTPRARTLAPGQVDWRAVASGRRFVNLRQRPGPGNMMGRVKFMMPNDLGVYLHDTPLRHFFARADRRISSGCVRLEDASRLARWLFEGRPPQPSGAAEQRVDLPEAVPVYIAYFTALPSRDGIVFQPDRYGRDRSALARQQGPGPVRANPIGPG
jgi:murein L,D-transpeptidase YcbB/YkuD